VNCAGFIGMGAPRFYYNFIPEPPGAHFAQVIVNTNTDEEAKRLQHELNARASEEVPEGRVQARLMQQGVPSAASVEVRVPFADHRILEYVYNVPWEIKFENGTEKALLRNAMADLEDMQIIGIDDKEHDHQVETVLRSMELDPAKFSVVMYHRPTGFEYAAERGIDLMVSGHTHNGQIFPFNYLVKTRFPRIKGVHRIGPSTLIVSMGSGFWGPPMRLGSRTEIYVIRLRQGVGNDQ
jgi:hypothetical protein